MTQNFKKIPRLVIAATQSGSGKTTIVAGLLAALRERGLKVQSYKVGPDYIDPGYHELASGRPAHNLDTWLTPAKLIPSLFAAESAEADLAVVEGVMGLFDGGKNGVSSTAQVAKILQAPVLLVIDVKSMGASAAAIAKGFRAYDEEVRVAGVILNRLGSATHEAMIREAMAGIDMPVYGALRRSEELKMPERHLGLLPVQENEERQVVQKMGRAVGGQLAMDEILALAATAPPLMTAARDNAQLVLPKCRIGVARDEAFSFYYPTSLSVLQRLGAELVPFSPLHDRLIPDVDGLLIGGGFPEMFAAQLAANETMCESVRTQAAAGMPVYAECGGYMYLMDSLRDFQGNTYAMAGVFPGQAVMTSRLQMVGYVTAEMQQDTILGRSGDRLQGHEFHFSAEEGEPDSRPFRFTRLRNGVQYEAGQTVKNVLGSYLHLHFAGCPEAAEAFVRCCQAWKRNRESE